MTVLNGVVIHKSRRSGTIPTRTLFITHDTLPTSYLVLLGHSNSLIHYTPSDLGVSPNFFPPSQTNMGIIIARTLLSPLRKLLIYNTSVDVITLPAFRKIPYFPGGLPLSNLPALSQTQAALSVIQTDEREREEKKCRQL